MSLMPASELDFSKDYPNFPEFRRFGIDLQHMSSNLILEIQQLRTMSGIPMTPSPVIAGWYRFNGSRASRHSAFDRMSDAGDLFPARGRAIDCWLHAQACRFNGYGLYGDTRGPDGKPQVMLHLDKRDGQRVYWVRWNGVYYTWNRDPVSFWRVFEYIRKQDYNVR